MIKEFQGEYRWLSNFAYADVVLDGVTYRSVEHAYMAAKSLDKEWRFFCKNAERAGDVKRASRGIILRDDWENVKTDVMYQLLKQKYNLPRYQSLLLATGDEYIQEGNMWNDKFWGVCLKTGKGENVLGKLIMKIRDDIKASMNG